MKFLGRKSDYSGRDLLKVGIIGACKGAGTTHFALMTANYFANGLGYKTAVAECNGHGDYIKICNETDNMDRDMKHFLYKGIDFCTCNNSDELGRLYAKKYDVVICDMDCDIKDNVAEFFRCDVRIVTGSTAMYKIGKFKRVIENFEDVDFVAAVFMADKKELKKLIKNYNITIMEIPVEVNPLKITSGTLEWFVTNFRR